MHQYEHYHGDQFMPHDHLSEGLLGTVQDCAATCEHMIGMLHKSKDMYGRGIQLSHLRDCADMCELMSRYLARNSQLSKSLAKYCAYVCEVCGNTCRQFPDPESQRCAQTCFHCAKECNEFAAI
ncbi:four-helix bundle copper-binding protein [Bacillaceae bacterium S4-13-58]